MQWDVLRRYENAGPLTPRERAVADFYARSLPGAAFLNLHRIAEAAGVSTATVARFARKLGYADFRELATSLRADARVDLERPGDRIAQSADGGSHPSVDRLELARSDLTATARSLDPDAMAAAAALLADESRPLILAAVASGRPLLDHIGLLLSYVRGNVHVLGGLDHWPHQLAGLDGNHVLLAAAYDRDPTSLLHVLSLARKVGASTIALSNVATSDLLASADVALRISTGKGTPFGSRVATLAVLESLVAAVADASTAGTRRADAIEATFDALGIHPRSHMDTTTLK